MFSHDPAPPVNPPLPGKPLDQLQVVDARHVLLYVAQEAQGLRTALGAMTVRSDQQRLVTTEKVVRGVQSLIDGLTALRESLGSPPEPAVAVHYLTAEYDLTLCGLKIRGGTLVSAYPVQVTCGSCARILRARERNE